MIMQRYILILWLIGISALFAFNMIDMFKLLVLFLLYKYIEDKCQTEYYKE